MRTFFFCKYWIASDWQCRSWGTIVLRQRHHKDPLGHAFMGLIVGGLRFLEAQDLFGVRELCHHQTTLQYFPSNMWWGSRFGVSPYVVVIVLVQFSSVAQSCLTLCNPMNRSTTGLPVFTNSQSPPKPMSIELLMPSNHLILGRPLLLLPSIFPSIQVFSNESAFSISWPKYWSFSCNISASSEHPGLISFRMDWLDLLAVQGTLKSLLQHHSILFTLIFS